MCHITLSANWWAFFFHLFIYLFTFSPTVGRRDKDKKWNKIDLRSTVEYMFSLDKAYSVKMAGYLPCSFSAFSWTPTSSRSTKTQQKNLANIHPSWPHAWSVTYVNIFHADPSKSSKRRQCKIFTSDSGICLTYGSVDFLFLVIWFIKC